MCVCVWGGGGGCVPQEYFWTNFNGAGKTCERRRWEPLGGFESLKMPFPALLGRKLSQNGSEN